MFTVKEIVESVKGKLISGSDNIVVEGISTDSRSDCLNKLFIPLIGDKFNGHKFIKNAVENGAVATLAQEDINIEQVTVIKVNDTLKALGKIAKSWIKKNSFKVIAITGSAGKTTTKELLKFVTGFKGTEKNFNNLIGVPLSIFNAVPEDKFLILELGTNCKGEIEQLRNITNPEYVIVTGIGYGHIEGFGTLESVFEEKMSLIKGNNALKKAFINFDSKIIREKLPSLKVMDKIVKIGSNQDCDVILLSTKSSIDKGNKIEFSYKNKFYKLTSKLLGKHNALNILNVFALSVELGFEESEILDKIERFKPVEKRCEILKSCEGVTIINDSYNANFNSFNEAVNLLDEVDVEGNKVLIIGDMFELGEMSEVLHKKLGENISKKNFDKVIGIGSSIKFTIDAINSSKIVKYYPDKERAKKFLGKVFKKGDVVLVKASRGMRFEEIVEFIKTLKLAG